MTTKKCAVLIVNLGSPNTLSTRAVRQFLRQFLSDPRVVNLPRSIWWVILNFLILPFRPFKSIKAYREIWTDKGSPLIYLTQALTDKIAEYYQQNAQITVDMVMSYGQPSITKKLRQLEKQQCEQIVVVPLYPQYSSTTTASVFDAMAKELLQWRYIPEVNFISDYHQHTLYIDAIANSIKMAWFQQEKADLLLMSFHGLPDKLTEWGEPYFHQCHQSPMKY